MRPNANSQCSPKEDIRMYQMHTSNSNVNECKVIVIVNFCFVLLFLKKHRYKNTDNRVWPWIAGTRVYFSVQENWLNSSNTFVIVSLNLPQIDSLAKTGESITVDGIITALQRFMFRYMSSEEMRPHPGGDLLDSMMEPSLWPMESFKNRPPQHVVPLVIPSILTIGHVHSALSFYQDHKASRI